MVCISNTYRVNTFKVVLQSSSEFDCTNCTVSPPFPTNLSYMNCNAHLQALHNVHFICHPDF